MAKSSNPSLLNSSVVRKSPKPNALDMFGALKKEVSSEPVAPKKEAEVVKEDEKEEVKAPTKKEKVTTKTAEVKKPVKETSVVEEKTIEPTEVKAEPSEVVSVTTVPSLNFGKVKAKKDKKKSYTFYIKESYYEKISLIAKQNDISISEVIDYIFEATLN